MRSAASLPPPYQTGPPVFGGVAGERDRVSGDLAAGASAVAQADVDPGGPEGGEEFLLGRGEAGGGRYGV
ncbi:MAG TPA: hypothetical protein VLW50_04255 [Streptosporangiaceae bacterium]|nr:hypothetical protein [Streptosporangiaceae bacterium]